MLVDFWALNFAGDTKIENHLKNISAINWCNIDTSKEHSEWINKCVWWRSITDFNWKSTSVSVVFQLFSMILSTDAAKMSISPIFVHIGIYSTDFKAFELWI